MSVYNIEKLWKDLYDNFGLSSKRERFAYVILAHSTKEKFESAIIEFQKNGKFSNTQSFRDAIQEWDVSGVHMDDEHNDDTDTSSQCICSQHIHNIYDIKRGGIILEVGNVCINKFGTSEQKINMEALVKRRKNNDRVNRQCLACGSYKIPPTKPSFHIRCKKCWENNNPILDVFKEECNSCLKKTLTIADDKDICTECYNKYHMKACISCNMNTIPIDSPKWKIRCIDCYKKYKNN